MNVILILIDSLNRWQLAPYAPSSISTPHLDAFAARSWRFDNHFVGSLPCMPARREIFTGRKEMMWRPWGPLEPFDARLPRLLEGNGHSTAIVTDHYHYWEESANGYIQSFRSAELVRGHEVDFWKTPIPADEPVPEWVKRIEQWRPGKGRQYYANVRDFAGEEEFFPASVMRGASQWLRGNAATNPFFLQVESFDVHEPFHVPEPYASMYGRASDRDRFTMWPPYQNASELTAFMNATSKAELDFIASQYAGKLTMVDRWLGELLATLDDLALWDETMVILTTDHGHDLGDRRAFGKQYPHYDSHANIPLFIWHPKHRGDGRAKHQLTSTVDLFATILNASGASHQTGPHSKSLLPVLEEPDVHPRQALLYGSFGQGVCCTDGGWTLFKGPKTNDIYSYSSLIFDSLIADTRSAPVAEGRYIPGVTYPQWKTPVRFPLTSQAVTTDDHLFHRAEDPDQLHDVWDSEPEQRARMLDLMRSLIEEEGAPPEQFVRLGLA